MSTYSPDDILWAHELKHCEDDFNYLAQTYLRFKSKEVVGFPTLKLNTVQQWLYAQIQDQWQRTGKVRKIFGKSRQVGSSTLCRALSFHRVAFRDHINALLVAHDEPDAAELFQLDMGFYDALPPRLKPILKYRSKWKMEFTNRNSKVLVNHARNMHVGASQMNHIVHLTEVARYPNGNEVQSSLFPSISAATGRDCSIVILESTSRYGGDWFKQFAEAAIRGENEYEFHFVPWYMHDRYTRPVPAGFEPTAEELDMLHYHPTMTWGNLVWYRLEKGNFVGNLAQFYQNYPMCVAAGTRISTQRGLLPIEATSERDVTESGEIITRLDHGVRETIQLTTALGFTLRCTPDHRVQLADQSWCEAAQALGKPVRLVPPRFAENYHTETWHEFDTMTTSVLIDEAWGRFLGYFVGDGSIYFGRGSQHPLDSRAEIDIACTRADQDVVEDVAKLWHQLFGVNPYRRVCSGGNRGGESLRYTSRAYGRIFYHLGLTHRAGADQNWTRKVCVPDVIWKSPRSVVREFLRGLYESDGTHSSQGDVLVFSKYKPFLQDVQLLLLGFGITSRLGKWNLQPPYTGGHVLHCRSNESKRFMDLIGFVGARKHDKFIHPTRPRMGRRPKPLVYESLVTAIEPSEPCAVHDLNLPPPHSFGANGIAVHNCWEASWVLPEGTMRTFPDDLLAYTIDTLHPGQLHTVDSTGLHMMLSGDVEVWQPPKEGVAYDMGIDIAGGQSKESDWTVLSVIRRDTLEQVAEARGKWNPADIEFFNLVHWLARTYNTAQLIPDITSGWGHALMTDLQKRAYPNIWQWRRRDDAKERVSQRLGFYYTKQDKRWMVTNAVKVIQREKPLIRSRVLYHEMRNFLQLDLDVWGASPGTYDDAINAYMLALVGATDERPLYRVTAPDTPTPTVRSPWSYHDIDADLDADNPRGSWIDRVLSLQ